MIDLDILLAAGLQMNLEMKHDNFFFILRIFN